MHCTSRAVKHQNDEHVDNGYSAACDKRDIKEEIKSNSSANNLLQLGRRKFIEEYRTYLCNIGSNDCGLCKEVKNIVKPRREMSLAVLSKVHSRDGA